MAVTTEQLTRFRKAIENATGALPGHDISPQNSDLLVAKITSGRPVLSQIQEDMEAGMDATTAGELLKITAVACVKILADRIEAGLYHQAWAEVHMLLQQVELLHAIKGRMESAPLFTDDQIASFNEYQTAGFMHPFTCPTNHDGDRDLVARFTGLHCPQCDYVQTWAHAWMLDWSWKKHNPFAQGVQ